jgi:hypothetical protein
MLCKILRYQGRFQDSLTHLELAKGLADRHRDLTFIEDRSDQAWSLADTFQKLDAPTRGEHYIRTEMERLGPWRVTRQLYLSASRPTAVRDAAFAIRVHGKSSGPADLYLVAALKYSSLRILPTVT